MNEWISVNKEYPSEDQNVLIYRTSGRVEQAYYISSDHCYWVVNSVRVPRAFVSHWMPLPELPGELDIDNLRPCPFCKGNDIIYVKAYNAFACRSCGGRGPLHTVEYMSHAGWNGYTESKVD